MVLPLCRRSGSSLSVAIPGSILSAVPHLREQTSLAGFLGRAAAIFQVDRIIVYRDLDSENQDKEVARLVKILEYLDTPQYLRKLLYPKDDDLRYVGILPPLRAPHHPLPDECALFSPGRLREGVVVDSGPGGSQIDIGIGIRVAMIEPYQEIGSRVTVKMLRGSRNPLARLARPEEIQTYWGYIVFDSKTSLGGLLANFNFDLRVATSRRGRPWNQVVEPVKRELAKADSTLLLFGSHKAGLQEILSRENLKLDDVVQFTVNTIPSQGTATVRTEEALFASLALLRVLEET